MEEKIGGSYDDLIQELSEIRKIINATYDDCITHLGEQIVEETLQAFDNILRKYEIEKDIEIISALDE